MKRRPLPQLPSADVPTPREKAPIGEYYAILAPGIGGAGVVTINALLATAAWIDGLSAVTLDQTGVAQKGGARHRLWVQPRRGNPRQVKTVR